MLEAGLEALLIKTPAVIDFIETQANRSDNTTGIFPALMPEDTPLPAIVYAQVGTPWADNSLDGAQACQAKRIEFSCYGRVYGDAKGTARAIRSALVGLHQTLGDSEHTEVDDIRLVSEIDLFEYDPFMYRTVVDLEIVFRDPNLTS